MGKPKKIEVSVKRDWHDHFMLIATFIIAFSAFWGLIIELPKLKPAIEESIESNVERAIAEKIDLTSLFDYCEVDSETGVETCWGACQEYPIEEINSTLKLCYGYEDYPSGERKNLEKCNVIRSD